MLQIAVFVDAGYLHAQGSALLVGSTQRRDRNRLNVPLLVADLIAESRAIEPLARLLRVYWYDGVARGGVLNLEQRTLSQTDNVKCRFGVINSRGQQKGVDSLIVTDLIQLSREQACSDALILSGDEDLRVGVQVAQTFGIRVHLLGLHPARGSQSPDLLAEADTTREWGRERVSAWLTVADANPDDGGFPEVVASGADPVEAPAPERTLSDIARERVRALSSSEAAALLTYADGNRGQIPPDFDRPALGRAKLLLGRELSFEERRSFRLAVSEQLRLIALRSASGEDVA